jgi:hypothetical protein
LNDRAYRGGRASANRDVMLPGDGCDPKDEQILAATAARCSLSQVLRNLRDFAVTCRNA